VDENLLVVSAWLNTFSGGGEAIMMQEREEF